MSNKRNISVFNRLFAIHTLLLILIYLLSVAFFLNNIRQSSQGMVESKRIQTKMFLANLEQQLDSIYSQEVSLANSAIMSTLAYGYYKDNYERSQLLLEILKTIQGIQSMSPLIEEIVATFPSQGIRVSTRNGYNRGSEWEQVEKGAEYDYFISYDNRIIMNFTYPLMYSENDSYVPDFNIQVVLSPDQLEGSLGAFNDGIGSGAAIRFRVNREYIIEIDDGSIVAGYYRGSAAELKDYQFISSDSMKFPISVVAFIDKQVFRDIIMQYITILTIVMVILTSLYALSLTYTKRIIIKPLKELMGAFDKIRGGDFEVRIYHEPHDEYNYLYAGFNDTVTHIQELIDNIYEQEDLIQNAELAQLQSQINPHFLYNSFFIINRMAKNEAYDQITSFVTSLARYYRYINKETSPFIPLEKEIEHMANYIDIQQMRFSDKISVELADLPLEYRNISVPKLILQPVIENAYNYGLADKLEDGLIKISYEPKGTLFTISVEDNGEEASDRLIESMGNSLDVDIRGSSHALANIHRRLVLAFGTPCGVSVDRSILGGVKVTLIIDMTSRPDR